MDGRPEEFRLVDLNDRHTWPNATIQDWIKLRQALLGTIPSDKDKQRMLDRNIALHKKAYKQLVKEMKALGRGIGPFLSGRQEDRYRHILQAPLAASFKDIPRLTRWEQDFLKASTWVDEIYNARRDHPESAQLIGTLFDWCWKSDIVRGEILIDTRAREKGSVSLHSGTGMPKGKNAYLPDSIELLQLYRLAYLLVAHMRNGATIADEYKLKVDRYGSAFPCPKCREKHFYSYFAERCCGVPYDPEKSDRLADAIPISSPSHRANIDRFYDLLWRFGYDTPAMPDDMHQWQGWNSISSSTSAAFTIQFLAAVFRAQPETVRRRLAKRKLEEAYVAHNIDINLRDYLDRGLLGLHAELRPKGWYLDKINGKPAGPIQGKRLCVIKW